MVTVNRQNLTNTLGTSPSSLLFEVREEHGNEARPIVTQVDTVAKLYRLHVSTYILNLHTLVTIYSKQPHERWFFSPVKNGVWQLCI